MFRVETFKDPMVFYNNMKVEMDEVHITSIPTLAMHIKKQGNHTTLWNVWIYHHFYKAIYTGWTRVVAQLEHKRLIRELIKTHSEEFGKHYNTLLRQVDILSQTFRECMELGFESIAPVGKETVLEQHYITLYNYFVNLPEMAPYKQELKKELTPQELDRCLDRYNLKYQKERREGYPFIKRIYFYSMESLSADKVAFLEKLSEAGYEVIFRIPYSKQYTNIHECWRKVYEKFVPQEEWVDLQPELLESTSALKEFLEGKNVDSSLKRKIYYHEMAEPILFKKYLQEHPMDRKLQEYIASQDEALNEHFRDEIQKENQISHFYETPLGRFVNKLYSLKFDDEHVYMDYETFITMMSSGIIVISGANDTIISGSRSIGLLSELGNYMEGVKTLEEILERLDDYVLLSAMNKEFEEQGRSKAERNRVKRYLQNPFRAFGFVYNGGYNITLNQLIELANKLQAVIRKLLIEVSPITNMEAHVEAFKDLITQSQIITTLGDEENSENIVFINIYRKFFGILNKQLIATKIYDLEDINEYVALRTVVESADEAQGKLILIKGIEHILGMCVNGVENVYLCDLSTINMNAYINNRMSSKLLFSLDELKSYSKNVMAHELEEKTGKILDITKIAMNQTQNFIKYGMIILMTYYKGHLHFGWIKNMNVHDTPWYLLNIIRSLSEVEEVESAVELEEAYIMQPPEEAEEVTTAADQIYDYISPLAWKDLETCELRFYYSNMLNHYPVYHEDFTQRQAFAQLCKMMEETVHGKENVKQFIYPLFPQWNDTLKQNMVDIQEAKPLKKYISYDNVEFPEQMIGIQYLSRYKPILNERSTIQKQEMLTSWLRHSKTGLKAHAGIHCDRCPHQLLCREGELAIEREY